MALLLAFISLVKMLICDSETSCVFFTFAVIFLFRMKVLALVLGIVASAFAQGKSVGWIKIAAR